MAGKQKKEEVDQEQVTVDLKPLQDEIKDLHSKVEQLEKQMKQLKTAPQAKSSSVDSSALAQQLIEALKEMTGPSTKGVRNYIRSVFK